MKRFRKIISPPAFEDDEKTRQAEFLHYSSILVFISSLTLIWLNLQFGSQIEISLNWTLGVIAGTQIVAQWMIRSGYVKEASLILLVISWAVMTELAQNLNGIYDVSILSYMLILLVAGYLLGWKISIVFTVASIVSIWWLASMENTGYITPIIGNPYRVALDLTVIYLLIALVIYFLIRTLTKALERTQKELQERIQVEKALESKQEFLRLALSAAHMGTWNWDIVTEAVTWSDNVARLFGLSEGQFDGRYETYLSLIHPDDLPIVQQAIESTLSGVRSDYIVVHRVIWPDGNIRYLEGRGNVFLNENGQPKRMAGAVADVTDRELAETEREHLIRDLETKNKELEQFTYTVSHDLKAPLITINGFLGYLAEDAREGKAEKVQQDIKRITEATSKMNHLLDELLELSRIGRMVNPPEDVHFEQIVQEAIRLVEGQLIKGNVEVQIADTLGKVHVDRARLVQVLQNLLNNAAKYMGDTPKPVIQISRQGTEDGKPIFFVRDNGIGISPEYHEKIFGLFNQLDGNSEGTGVGLALVKRIVELHGGRIWVESEAGEGATFYFTLPLPLDAERAIV